NGALPNRLESGSQCEHRGNISTVAWLKSEVLIESRSTTGILWQETCVEDHRSDLIQLHPFCFAAASISECYCLQSLRRARNPVGVVACTGRAGSLPRDVTVGLSGTLGSPVWRAEKKQHRMRLLEPHRN